VARYAPDDRLVVAFRDRMVGSPFYGHFVVWVGRYGDIVNWKTWNKKKEENGLLATQFPVFSAFVLTALENIRNDPEAMEKFRTRNEKGNRE
jgi:hypothetical protein